MIEGLPVNELALKAWFYTTIFLIWHEVAGNKLRYPEQLAATTSAIKL